jgi:hypothetical protein
LRALRLHTGASRGGAGSRCPVRPAPVMCRGDGRQPGARGGSSRPTQLRASARTAQVWPALHPVALRVTRHSRRDSVGSCCGRNRERRLPPSGGYRNVVPSERRKDRDAACRKVTRRTSSRFTRGRTANGPQWLPGRLPAGGRGLAVPIESELVRRPVPGRRTAVGSTGPRPNSMPHRCAMSATWDGPGQERVV